MSWFTGILSGFSKFKTFIVKIIKYGSVAMGLLIPLVLLLNWLGFVRNDFVFLITEIIIYVGLGEIVIKIGFRVYRAEKAENAKLNIAIKVKNIEELSKFSEEEKSIAEFLTDEVIDKAFSLIKPKEKTQETSQNIESEIKSIPEHEISAR